MISTIHHLYFLNVLNVQVHYITLAIIVNPTNKNNNNLIWLLCIKNIGRCKVGFRSSWHCGNVYNRLPFGLCFLWFGIGWCWRSISCFWLLASLPYMSIDIGIVTEQWPAAPLLDMFISFLVEITDSREILWSPKGLP